ncbi:helix-turn-helix domain-containing protein [Proteiniphilum sp.]|uniref:AlbA family DNA-binding domain-containing protein n=1 Tax=Proteiniphilum sp. TaxID=1926877 RepID=UPI002B20965D|nr:RNA-binding domain-containing protein [Proteiniphilum sp.]MEA4917258.1 putative DNA binding domain-containing protein [Proteiniphilum sp.]
MNKDLIKELDAIISLSRETEWVEFKRNFHSPEEIGEQILANSACLHNKPYGYLVFGSEDGTHTVIGTDFKPKSYCSLLGIAYVTGKMKKPRG